MRKKIFLFITLILTSVMSFAQDGIDLEDLRNQLKGDGLGGWVHGSVQDQSMLVFTWRSPDNFFVNVQLPMQTKDPVVAEQLSSFRRHDYIIIKGDFFDNRAPIRHISVSEVVSHQPWDGPTGEYEYSAVPDSLLNQTEGFFKVHATANEGSVLVVEYKDRVFPVFNRDRDLVTPLFRNDIIKMKYLARVEEGRPIHMAVNFRAENPIEVVERIETGHGEPIELTGSLVMFPKSPQIKFNVYALRTENEHGLRRNYTLINFENIDLFLELRDVLERVWVQKEENAVYDRNKFINRGIKITAKGIKNVVSPDQANPQIIINNIEDVTFDFEM